MTLTKNLRLVLKDKLALILSFGTALIILATWSLFLFKKINYSDLTVIHSNVFVGIDVLGTWRWLFIIPGLTLLFSIIDFVLAIGLWIRQRLWSYICLVCMFFINIFLFLYLYNIINSNLI